MRLIEVKQNTNAFSKVMTTQCAVARTLSVLFFFPFFSNCSKADRQQVRSLVGPSVAIVICACLPTLSAEAQTDAARHCKRQGRRVFLEISETLARIISDQWEPFGG